MAADAEYPPRAVLHQTTQDRIKRFIIGHGYRPGDALPGEAELARQLGVSRPSLREAMRALQTVGVVETRHGSGSFVGRFSLEALVGGLAFSILVDGGQNMRTVRELVEIRQILERELVAQVAQAATPEQIARLDTLVERMEVKAARGEPFDEEDRAFHEALYLPLGNDLVVQLLRAFWDAFHAVRDELAGLPPMLVDTAANHRRIVAPLAAGNADAAAAAMSAHFDGIRERIGLWEAATRARDDSDAPSGPS